MNVSQSIIKALEDIGVDTVFAGSGQSDADLLFALDESDKINTVIIRNEQAASFMACGYAMFSDKLGVCITTAGPGAFNLFSGMAVALSDSLPILGVTGYAAKASIGKGDLGETTGHHRTPDSQAMFAATTKATYLIECPEQTCHVLEQAINTAFEGRPGPVHIHLPYDVAPQEVPNYRPIKFNIEPVLPMPKKARQLAGALAAAMQAKKRILALLGYGCIRSHAEVAILQFLERYQIPWMTTMDAKGILPENHPLCVGTTGVSGDPGAKLMFKQADLVLAMGNSFAKWSAWKSQPDIYDDKTLLHVNIDRKDINKVYAPDYALISDIKPAVAAIAEALDQVGPPVAQAEPIIEKYAHQKLEQKTDKIHPGMLAQQIGRLAPERAIIMGDAGAHMLWLHAYMELNSWQNYQNPGSFGPMASHVNGVIGVQCANPERRVICGCGDGDYQMAGFELMTAVQNRIPVIWIIFNNSEFNVIRMLQLSMPDSKEVFNRFLNPDFAAYARTCGARGYRVEIIEDFEPAFRDALSAQGQPSVLDVIVDADTFPPFSLYAQ